MKLKILVTLNILILLSTISSANPAEQRPSTDANIFGHIIDGETGEHVPFVNLQIKGSRIGTITDVSGHYILTNLPEGSHILIASAMGYGVTEIAIEAKSKTTTEVDITIKNTGINLAEIVLTASPTASGFRYQPDAVFMGEQIQRRGEPSFGEMLNGQPGVAMRSFGSAPARPVIRGMDGDRILVLENGERMGDISETSADHSISLDPLAASRVEVIRGPASLLYGSSALGGVINLMTTDIPDTWDEGVSGVFSGQAATVNNMGAGFMRVTGGREKNAFTGRFAMRQAGDITTPEGKIEGTSMKNYDGAAGWAMNNGKINGGLSISGSNQEFEIPESIDDPSESVEIRANRLALQGRFGRNINESFFDQAQLRFSTTHFSQQEVEIEHLPSGISEEEIELEYEQVAFSSTLTFQHKPIGVLARGALGFNFNGKHLQIIGDDAYTPGEQRLSLAAFTFQEMPISNMLRMQFGIRLDYQNSKALKNDIFPDLNLTRNSLNYSGSMGLNIRPYSGIEIGAQFARSHRNPMVEELFSDGAHLGAAVYEKGNPLLKDEIGHGGDIFITIKRGIFELEVTAFVNNFSNYIIFEPTGQIDAASGYQLFEYTQGAAIMNGNEVSLISSLTNSLTFQNRFDFVRGKRIIEHGTDEYLPFIPPFRLTNEINYDFGKGWISASYQWVARQGKTAPEEDTTEGYTLLGFQAGYRLNSLGRHVLIARVDNTLDTKYRDHLSRVEDRNFYMPGRNINISYRWFF